MNEKPSFGSMICYLPQGTKKIVLYLNISIRGFSFSVPLQCDRTLENGFQLQGFFEVQYINNFKKKKKQALPSSLQSKAPNIQGNGRAVEAMHFWIPDRSGGFFKSRLDPVSGSLISPCWCCWIDAAALCQVRQLIDSLYYDLSFGGQQLPRVSGYGLHFAECQKLNPESLLAQSCVQSTVMAEAVSTHIVTFSVWQMQTRTRL